MAIGLRSFFRSVVRCSVTTEQGIIDSDSESSSEDSASICSSCSSCRHPPTEWPYHERIVLIDQSMDDLPDDILHLVIRAISKDGDLPSIKRFSMVSRRARTISLPYMFRDHCWRPGSSIELLPSRFWGYIRCVVFLCHVPEEVIDVSSFRSFHLIVDGRLYGPGTADNRTFAAALPKMTNLVRFRLTGPINIRWRALLLSVAFLPQLSSLEVVCSFGSLTPIVSPTTFIRSPTRLVLHFHREWQDAVPHRPEPLPNLFSLCSGNVEYLELCENSLQLDLLVAQEWPELREFVICGHSLNPGTSITHLLKRMPRLRRLDLANRCRPESANLVLWSRPPEDLPNPILTELTALAIAIPSNFDDSFSYLPSTLKSLSILAASPPPQPLDRDGLFRMLRGIRAADLTTLRFVMDGALDDSLFSFINSTFPLLEVLGIHRFPRHRNIEKAVRLHFMPCLLSLTVHLTSTGHCSGETAMLQEPEAAATQHRFSGRSVHRRPCERCTTSLGQSDLQTPSVDKADCVLHAVDLLQSILVDVHGWPPALGT